MSSQAPGQYTKKPYGSSSSRNTQWLKMVDVKGYRIGYEFSRGKRAEQLLILKLLVCGLTIQL